MPHFASALLGLLLLAAPAWASIDLCSLELFPCLEKELTFSRNLVLNLSAPLGEWSLDFPPENLEHTVNTTKYTYAPVFHFGLNSESLLGSSIDFDAQVEGGPLAIIIDSVLVHFDKIKMNIGAVFAYDEGSPNMVWPQVTLEILALELTPGQELGDVIELTLRVNMEFDPESVSIFPNGAYVGVEVPLLVGAALAGVEQATHAITVDFSDYWGAGPSEDSLIFPVLAFVRSNFIDEDDISLGDVFVFEYDNVYRDEEGATHTVLHSAELSFLIQEDTGARVTWQFEIVISSLPDAVTHSLNTTLSARLAHFELDEEYDAALGPSFSSSSITFVNTDKGSLLFEGDHTIAAMFLDFFSVEQIEPPPTATPTTPSATPTHPGSTAEPGHSGDWVLQDFASPAAFGIICVLGLTCIALAITASAFAYERVMRRRDAAYIARTMRIGI